MARQIKRLTTWTVTGLTKPGRHADGGNLYLTISKTTDGLSKRWTFLCLPVSSGKLASGRPPLLHLRRREKASGYRSLLSRSIDPLAAKQAAKAAESARRTFGECADDFLKSKSIEWRSPIHTRQWTHALDTLCQPNQDVLSMRLIRASCFRS